MTGVLIQEIWARPVWLEYPPILTTLLGLQDTQILLGENDIQAESPGTDEISRHSQAVVVKSLC